MLHEIGNHIFNNQYRHRELTENDLYIYSKNNQILVKKENQSLHLPNVKDDGILPSTFLFTIDEVGFYLLENPVDGYETVTLKEMRYLDTDWLRFGIITAVQLANWYNNNKFCGRCGQLTYHDDKERMIRCSCGNMIFPKICPVAIVGVIKGDRMLLTKYADKARFARYALIAGFCEIGESIEDTVRREVKEETNLSVKNIRYFSSQPWSFSDSLIFGFFAELDGEDDIQFTDNELSVAQWFLPEEMPQENEHASITYLMMDEFRRKGRDVLK